MGPFQTLTLLATSWGIQWQLDDAHPLQDHKLPLIQIIDNLVGGPAFWLFTWAIYAAYTRGHLTSALIELIESIQEVKQKPKLRNTPPP